MPYIDVAAAQRELDAEAEPIELNVQVYEDQPDGSAGMVERVLVFPGAMPAQVNVEQMAIERRQRKGEPNPEGAEERLMRAYFGEHYEYLRDCCPSWEQARLMRTLMREWMDGLADPTRVQVEMTHLHEKAVPLREHSNSNDSSSKSSGPSKPTSNGNTASISHGRSGRSPGAALSVSTGASAAKR